MKPTERLKLMDKLLGELTERVAGDRDNLAHVGPRALSARADDMLKHIERVTVQVGLLTAELEDVNDRAEAGDDLVDALTTLAPSTMYPKIVADAMTAWVKARQKEGQT